MYGQITLTSVENGVIGTSGLVPFLTYQHLRVISSLLLRTTSTTTLLLL
jgi:hypothetical protein